MTVLALEINDAGLIGATEAGIVFEAEGIAWLGEQGVRFGSEASGKSRLEPDRISARHWQMLDQTPLARPRGGYHTQADVVFAHLEAIWGEWSEDIERVVFALPGCYERAQLGLLLGMCGRLDLPVAGFVDSALAATRHCYPGRELVHLELCLHRAILSHLDQGSRLRRSNVEALEQVGVVNVREALIKAIATEFVRERRFDPLHRAASEQGLYDQIPALCAAVRDRGAGEIVLESTGGPQRVEMTARTLDAAVSQIVRQLFEFVSSQQFATVPMVVELSAGANQIPDLAATLRAQGHPVVGLQPGAAALGALDLIEHLPHRSAVFLNEAPLPDVVEVPLQDTSTESAGMTQPTHVLYLDRAYRLTTTPLVIGREAASEGIDVCLRDPPPGISRRHCSVAIRDDAVVVEDHSTYGTWVNGVPVAGRTRLRLGDRIQLGNTGIEMRLIHVQSDPL